MRIRFVQRQSELLRRARLSSQNADSTPRSVSSVRRERAAEGSQSNDETSVLRHSSRHPGSPAGLCGRYPPDLAFVVTWDTAAKPEARATGHHQFVGLHVCPQLSRATSNDCALALNIQVPAIVNHNFGSGNCIIPVTVTVSNQQFASDGECLGFVLEAAESRISSLRWLGAVKQTVNALAPTESLNANFCASVSTPGVYDLNNFGVRMMTSGRVHSFPLQALVSVVAL